MGRPFGIDLARSLGRTTMQNDLPPFGGHAVTFCFEGRGGKLLPGFAQPRARTRHHGGQRDNDGRAVRRDTLSSVTSPPGSSSRETSGETGSLKVSVAARGGPASR
jgi:hypothetical protein